ncbi:hypothetical protein NQ317_017801 [Molorchus minor]|uniref:sn-1-specific diacylglycerol lipase ABHD11 n=1 Tax=Molorchus minor TaxID=1323400 RepID=A0ABQ9K1I9_9CUCU|nr:hypothetical protein NQ317_017801 [Molorchus minor]
MLLSQNTGLLRQNSLINFKNPRNFSSAETLEPVKLAYATYESTKSEGVQGVPLVILHGLFGSKSNWNSLCKVYQQKTDPQRKIIAADARNHGDSAKSTSHTYAHMAADIKHLLEDLGIDKASLMGHSMGGRAVMLFALKYVAILPELVEKLIVVDISPVASSPNLTSMPALFQALDRVRLPSNVSVVKARTDVDAQLAQFIADKSLRSFLLTNLVQKDNGRFDTKRLVNVFVKLAVFFSYNWRVNIPVLLANFNNIANFPLLNDMQYNGPVLFVGGDNSDFIATKSFQETFLLPKDDNIELSYASYEVTKSYSKTKPQPTNLIVLHGLLGSKNNWNSFCKKYHEHSKRKVVAIDIRNHGESPHTKDHSYDAIAIDLKRFLDKNNLQKVNFLGHSMGGRGAMLFTLKYPELVEKLIVADISPITTSPGFNRTPELLLALKNFELPKNVSFLEARQSVRDMLMPLLKHKAVLSFLLTNLVQKSNGSYAWRFNINSILNNFDNISTFPEVHNSVFEGPVLFVGGSKSDYIQKSDFPKIVKLFPKAELKFIEGAGHWVHSEKPTEFLKLTLDFFKPQSY